MRILNIYFKNINSLEGENRINFEQPPFSETGVFAITGPNGSGKSSILDAITLALYGETFRFNRPAEHVMTRNTQECFSCVEFALDNEKYRATWRTQRLANNDDYTPADMQLLQLSTHQETVLASGLQQVCKQITELTGMNFRNFTRSALLAQGDFAAFLNALDNERLDILEKIVSTDIYADYKNAIIDKVDKAQKRLRHLQQDLNAVPLLPPEDYEALSHDLLDFNDQHAELFNQQQQLKQQQQALIKVSQIEKQIVQQEQELIKLNEQLAVVENQLAQLSHAETALSLQEDIEHLEAEQKNLLDNKHNLTTYKTELNLLQEELATTQRNSSADSLSPLSQRSFAEQLQSIDRIRAQVGLLNANKQAENDLWKSLESQIAEKTANLTEIANWLQQHAVDAHLLQAFPDLATLKNLRLELIDIEQQQKTLLKSGKKMSSSLKSQSANQEKDNKKITTLKQRLADAEKTLDRLMQGKTLEDLEELYKDQNERVKKFQEIGTLATEKQKLSPQRSGLLRFFASKPEVDETVDSLQLKLDALKKELKVEENIKLALEEATFRNGLLKKMAVDRQHLIDGKPCPLCGALDHPYTSRPPVPSNTERALLDQKEKIQRLITVIIKQEKLLQIAQKIAEQNQIRDDRLQKIQIRWQTLSNQLNIVSSVTDSNPVTAINRLLSDESQQLKNISRLIEQYHNTQNLIKKLQALIKKTESHIENLQANTQILDADQQERNQLQQELNNRYTKCLLAEKNLSQQITEQLAVIGEKLPGQGKEEAYIELFNNRRQAYDNALLQQKSLTDDIATLTAKQEHCQTAANNYDTQIQSHNKQLQTEESLGLHLALVEKQKLIADAEQRVNLQEVSTQQLQQAFKEKIQNTVFATVHDVNQILQLNTQRPNLEQQKTELDKKITEKSLALQNNKTQLLTEPSAISPDLDPDVLDSTLRQIVEKLKIAEMEAHRAESLLADQSNFQKKYDSILLQWQEQQKVVQQLTDEMAQIDAENGMVFRRRVQQQITEQLLSKTNAFLEKISGRYYLRQKLTDQGLALEIEDTYQNNLRRLPKTLSGGESFVVSLALALGLSELANNGRSVDSLFIDEGFGNLDAETLYTVISTLESLQAHYGKTVGIISHVDSVQKRLKAQLQIVKKPNGMGMLKKAS